MNQPLRLFFRQLFIVEVGLGTEPHQKALGKVIVLVDVCGIKSLHVKIIIAGIVPFDNFCLYGVDSGIQITNLHGGDTIGKYFNVSHEFYKFGMAGHFT